MIGNNLLMAGDEGYNLTRSLRFRASASGYLSRTPASAGNQKTWTWSGWVKLGVLSGTQILFAGGTSANTYSNFYFSGATTGNLEFYLVTGGTVLGYYRTTALFRDPSAWYHIMLAVDTTLPSISLFVNGAPVAINTVTGFSLNVNTLINSSGAHFIANNYSAGQYFDGYLAEVNFIDGQALTPSSFGEFDTTTGVWKPKAYSGGSYGTNGFYLPFTDNSALTTSSNVGLGKDFSGNGNYWTTNNISITAGVTYDSMTDVPTLTSATAANYAVLNPLYTASLNSGTISNGNLDITCLSGGSASATHATVHTTTGKYYFEVTATSNGGYGQVGLGIQSVVSGTFIKYAGTSGDYTPYGVYGVAYDVDAGKMWIKDTSGSWTSGDPVAGTTPLFTFTANSETYPIAASGRTSGFNNPGLSSHNFGQRPFTYTPPSGFVALNTYNLPDSTIKQGNKVMDATVYQGTGGQPQTISNSGQFKPDLIWIKNRTSTYGHSLQDSVRGFTTGKKLRSDQTSAEGDATYSPDTSGYVTGATSTGFQLTYAAGGDARQTHNSNDNYVAWQWQAGQGSTSSNTSGTITSTTSVNASAGFSVVTYTGTGANATVGHGLGVAPSLIITKSRTNVVAWPVYTSFYGKDAVLQLESSTAGIGAAGYWGTANPTSSVFGVGTNNNNISGASMLAYCFAPIAGYSAFGSFVGNGSADGVFVYLGFRPKLVMIKRTDSAGNWVMVDSSRSTYNVNSSNLYANLSNAEDSANSFDFLSNGIKFRSTATDSNASGGTYIYAAFAENPFKNSLAR